jgi:Icc-related predicted phosphoesterase
MKITFISDTHNHHKKLPKLSGGDILIHAGDITSVGYQHEIREFCKWFNNQDDYTHKVFIAGNHDWGFQNNTAKIAEILDFYNKINYLQDQLLEIDGIKIWGSPWQLEFYNWAFNLQRGDEIQQKWNLIPNDLDILITHGPAWGILDKVHGQGEELGCQNLAQTILDKKPKIHICGHIHTGWGNLKVGDTHYFNASVLDERYLMTQNPINIEYVDGEVVVL